MKILHFADLHLGMENYSRIDAATGLPSRLLDFITALDKLVGFALEEKVDLVLFCGDAYKNREPTQTQQREFARRINKLASNGVAVFLLTGNHDLPNGFGRATAIEIFDTLAIDNVHVSHKPEVIKVETRSGTLQVATLPWLRRSALLSKEDAKNLTFEEVNARLEQILTERLSENIKKLDPALPSVLAAHVWVANAQVGSEKSMVIGQEHSLLLSNVANPAFDYVALGHVHKHQVLHENPPVVYSGSLERIDFSEEQDEKGFYLVEIDTASGKKQTKFEFKTVPGRRFLTINVALSPDDLNPTATVLQAIGEKDIKDAIVRLQISLAAEQESLLRDNEIRHALEPAHYCTVARDIKRSARIRLGNHSAEELQPFEALKAWLETQKGMTPERMKVLLEYGRGLIEKD